MLDQIKVINQLNLDIIRKLSKKMKYLDNLMISGYELYLTLAVLSVCFDGEKRKDLLGFLRLNVLSFFENNNNQGMYRIPCNDIFQHSTGLFVPGFLNKDLVERIKSFFQCHIQRVDLVNYKLETLDSIQSWAYTFSKSIGIILEDVKIKHANDNNSKMMFVNVLNFKSIWKDAFNPMCSYIGNFYTPYGVRSVYYMRKVGRFRLFLAKEKNCKVLFVPTSTMNLSILFIQSIKGGKIWKLVKKIDNAVISKCIEEGKEKMCEVHIPKFSMKVECKMKDYLKNSPIGCVFYEKSNKQNDCFLSENVKVVEDIYHVAKIKVNEDGLSSNAFEMDSSQNFEDLHLFKINQPFLAMLTDVASRTILFSAIIFTPNKAKK